MAKMYGFSGKLTGKKGDAVFAVRNGDQIVRQYNPIVANPSTQKQVDARAALKLSSQLSAAFATVIAIPREGSKTRRNRFQQVNYGRITANQGVAMIDLNTIQLTKSNQPMLGITANRANGTQILCSLAESGADMYDAVVYVIMTKNDDGSLRVHATGVATKALQGDNFQLALKYTTKSIVVYGYGVSYLNSRARGIFENMQAPTAEQIAQLFYNRTVSMNDARLSETVGLTIEAGQNSGTSSDSNRVAVTIVADGHSTCGGSGFYAIGGSCVAICTPDAGWSFAGFYSDAAKTNLLSSNNPYTFTVNGVATIYAKTMANFTPSNSAVVTLETNKANGGTISGAGTFEVGTEVTVVATPASGYSFGGWYNGANKVSTDASYTFTVDGDITLTANFVTTGGSQMHIVATSSDSSLGTVSGDGYYDEGSTCTLTATAIGGATFLGWYENDHQVSSNTTYSFTVDGDRVFVARFSDSNDSE